MHFWIFKWGATIIRVGSFDVFDTVITRSVIHPSAVFLLVGERLIEKNIFFGTPDCYRKLRINAEVIARKRSEGEVTFKEIIETACKIIDSQLITREILAELELEVESVVCVAVPGVKDIIRKCRQEYDCIQFLSDMYLPSGFIEKILLELGIYEENDRLIVSSQCQCSKSSGRLYDYVRKLYPTGTRFYHIGDNKKSDFTIARKKGWEASWFDLCIENRYEEIDFSVGDNVFLSRFLGSMRLKRISYSLNNCSQIRLLGLQVVGPLFMEFSQLLLNWCATEGTDVLVVSEKDRFMVTLLESLSRLNFSMPPVVRLTSFLGDELEREVKKVTNRSLSELGVVGCKTIISLENRADNFDSFCIRLPGKVFCVSVDAPSKLLKSIDAQSVSALLPVRDSCESTVVFGSLIALDHIEQTESANELMDGVVDCVNLVGSIESSTRRSVLPAFGGHGRRNFQLVTKSPTFSEADAIGKLIPRGMQRPQIVVQFGFRTVANAINCLDRGNRIWYSGLRALNGLILMTYFHIIRFIVGRREDRRL